MTNEKGEENLCESGFFAEIDFRTDRIWGMYLQTAESLF